MIESQPAEEIAAEISPEQDAETSTEQIPRRSIDLKPGETDPKNSKVKITTYLDADILEYFKKRAERPNAAPYQTQINNELRKIMESESADTVRGADDILNNEKFLRKLKEKLDTV